MPEKNENRFAYFGSTEPEDEQGKIERVDLTTILKRETRFSVPRGKVLECINAIRENGHEIPEEYQDIIQPITDEKTQE